MIAGLHFILSDIFWHVTHKLFGKSMEVCIFQKVMNHWSSLSTHLRKRDLEYISDRGRCLINNRVKGHCRCMELASDRTIPYWIVKWAWGCVAYIDPHAYVCMLIHVRNGGLSMLNCGYYPSRYCTKSFNHARRQEFSNEKHGIIVNGIYSVHDLLFAKLKILAWSFPRRCLVLPNHSN